MSKGGGGGPQTVTNKTELPAWVNQGGAENLEYAKQVAARPYEAYAGPTVAGLTADQTSAMDWIRANSTGAADAISGATRAITGGNLTSTAQSLLNPYLGNVEAGAEAQLQRSADQAQNDLASRAASAGAFGGTRFGVQSAELAGNTARQAGDLSANIRSQGWNTAVQTALAQAAGVTQGATAGQTAGLTGAGALASAGALQQNQAQTEMNAALANWQQARDYPLEQLAIRQSALSATPYGGTTSSTQPLNRGNQAMTGLSGAATGAALGGALAGTLGISSGLAAGGGAGLGLLLALL